MKKIALTLAALILFPLMAFAEPRPLCEFLNSITSPPSFYAPSIYAMYDGRFYDRKFFPSPDQTPNGGIKLSLELGTWPTPEQRDLVVDKIKRVRFTNTTNDQKLIINQPEKYIYTPYPNTAAYYSGDFYIWLGNKYNAIGSWEVQVVVEEKNRFGKIVEKKYEAEFDITDAFFKNIASDPVKNVVITKVGQEFAVCFDPSPLTNLYRIRAFDVNNDARYDSNFNQFAFRGSRGCITGIPSLSVAGKTARIEARMLNVSTRLDCSSSPNEWKPYFSRTGTYIKFPQ